ncbi:SDR family NAD(P)-dependent oxidoreductase [Burkholderia ambifaria]|uniref:SDR family NAD(P)-dependent oxidoreductase n=1 Tax=Burkholderia ambifaria TaxID=152480 RepID=UPI00158DA8A0|nr:SDR family oxidoreductase [Burkholderia ambifaria]MBY4769942.1 SDR family oxidoreductase [Burkholderia ambifaria]
MDLQLNGLNAVVTGGTAGIGLAIVETLAAEGANVWFCSRSPDRVATVAAALAGKPGKVHGTSLDVTEPGALARWISGIDTIDIFVPNVSAISGDWDASIDTDLRATIAGVEAVLPKLARSPHAALTYIGSKAGSFATPGFEAYGSVKAALAHYMKSLARKHVTDGVRVNVVSPGDTYDEGGFWGQIKRNAPEIYEATVQANPLGRLCTPAEIGRVVAFVSSPAAGFIAGANLLVDGASTAHVHG